MPESRSSRKASDQPSRAAVAIHSLAKVINTLIETFGWPGTLLILSFWFVVWYATVQQKQRIIEVYVLGEGINRLWPLLIASIVFVASLFGQRHYYLGKIKLLEDEVDREGKAKSELQAQLAQKQLQHATPTKPKRK